MVELNVGELAGLELVARGPCPECGGDGTIMSDDWKSFREWRDRRPTVSPEAEDDLVEQYFIVVCDFDGVPPMGVECGECDGAGHVDREVPVSRLVALLVEHVEQPLMAPAELDVIVDDVKRAITLAASHSRGVGDGREAGTYLRTVQEGAEALRSIAALRPQVNEELRWR